MTIYSRFERQANICIANSTGLTVSTAVIRQLTITKNLKGLGQWQRGTEIINIPRYS